MTSAFYLARKGYDVTIYEALPVLGGMLTVGIPEYRLPKDLLNEEINVIKEMGVKMVTNTAIGKDLSLEDLKKDFEAVYIAVGAHEERNMGIEGEDLDGFMAGTYFLRDQSLGTEHDLKGKKVVVVGGGNVAIDAARSSCRLGAEEVTMVYRRDKKDMPAIAMEVEEAEHENINILTMVNPVKVHGENGKVKAIECIKMRGGEFDRSGRKKPVEVEGSNFMIDVDVIIPAIGQKVDLTFNQNEAIEMKWGNVLTNGSPMTNVEGIFAGGDCVTGAATVVKAVRAGKDAAIAIDKYLGGDGVILTENQVPREIAYTLLEEECPRVEMPLLNDQERLSGFAEVELGYDTNAALKEASRCLRCDVKDK